MRRRGPISLVSIRQHADRYNGVVADLQTRLAKLNLERQEVERQLRSLGVDPTKPVKMPPPPLTQSNGRGG